MAVTLAAGSVDEARRMYPQYAWAFDNGDIGPILQQAVREGWPEERLTGAITQTNWWKTTLPALRNYEQTKNSDPAAIEQQIRQKLPELWDTWLGMGMTPTSETAPFLTEIARQSIQQNWSQGQLQDAIVSHVKFNPQQPAPVGSIGTTMQSMKQRARQYMLPLDDQTAFNYARSITAGERRAEDYDNMFREQAKGRLPTIAKYIDQGLTPEDYFAPYKSAIAEILERPTADIDFLSPQWGQVIDHVDDKGERRAMTMSEAQVFARKKPEYARTKAALAKGATLVQTILERFGEVA